MDLDHATSRFQRHAFWSTISGQVALGTLWCRNGEIHHPTLRFIHRWIAMSLFSRDDTRTVRQEELRLLFAIVNKFKVAPVKEMMLQWREYINFTGPISCTSLVTRIAAGIGALEN